jgi:hypothetical protein
MINDNASTSSSVQYQLQAKESDFCCDDDYHDDFSYYVSDDVRKRLEDDSSMPEHDKEIIQRLARRSFHLPGNTFWQDWRSFLCNNHPILGFKFAHPNHPFGFMQRLVNLVASIAFGLAATSIVVLWYYYKGKDMSKVAFTVYKYDMCAGNLSLLVFATGLHVVFDLSIWYIQACPFCRPNGLLAKRLSERQQQFWVYLGYYVALEITVFGLCLAVFVVLLRASVIEEGSSDDDKIIRIRQTGIQDYMFVAAILMEFAVTQVIMFPIVAFTLFSGILGCGRIPIIGGRPYQFRKYQQHAMQKNVVPMGDALIGPVSSSVSSKKKAMPSKKPQNRGEI